MGTGMWLTGHREVIKGIQRSLQSGTEEWLKRHNNVVKGAYGSD